MKPRNTLILLIVLIVLAALVLLLERPFGRGQPSEPAAAAIFFPDFDRAAADRIRVASPNQKVELTRTGESWVVPDQELKYPVDQRLVDQVLEKVEKLPRGNLVSQNPEKRSVFQADEAGVEVEITGGDRSLAHFYLGKSGPDFFSTYVRIANEDNVYLVADYLRSAFDKPVRNWKDRSLLKAEKDEIDRIEVVRREGGELAFARGDDGKWTVSAGGETTPAKETEMNTLLAGLSNFLATDYAAPAEGAPTGLDDPAIKVTITLRNGTAQTAHLGSETEGKRRFAKAPDGEWVLLLPSYRYDMLAKPAGEYRAPPASPGPNDAAPAAAGGPPEAAK